MDTLKQVTQFAGFIVVRKKELTNNSADIQTKQDALETISQEFREYITPKLENPLDEPTCLELLAY